MNISTAASRGNSAIRLLLDTQILIWFQAEDRRLKRKVASAIVAPENSLFVSAVVAWEYSDLRHRGKVAAPETIDSLRSALGFALLDLPAGVWADVEKLPVIHRDPMDRMLIAHARLAGLTLITSDAKIRRYPVETFW